MPSLQRNAIVAEKVAVRTDRRGLSQFTYGIGLDDFDGHMLAAALAVSTLRVTKLVAASLLKACQCEAGTRRDRV